MSAKTNEGTRQYLLDMIILVTELEGTVANPDALASGSVIESQARSCRGPVVSVLVNRGHARVGDRSWRSRLGARSGRYRLPRRQG